MRHFCYILNYNTITFVDKGKIVRTRRYRPLDSHPSSYTFEVKLYLKTTILTSFVATSKIVLNLLWLRISIGI